ncbi:MAG: hypothetical protein RIS47_1160 [Bacteroidota bacterium]|jgi:cysteine desulfurase/selenocysteine lyase
MAFDIQKIRNDFPILAQLQNGKPYVYLDNGATTQKPQVVIDAISEFYQTTYSNIHRGVHRKSEESTQAYEAARQKISSFINATHSREVIFTSGTTQSINTLAFSFGEQYVHEGDEIMVSEMEHHSNIVPWQMLCERKRATLKVIPITDQGELRMDVYAQMLNPRVKLVAVTYVSNTLGTITPAAEIIALAHAQGIPVMLDAAQAIQHIAIDVQKLDVDFLVFSGHKIYGPTGIGVLYGKEKWLEAMPPYMGGGDMIETVSFAKTSYASLPFKFEAGTMNFVDAHALGVAIDYVQGIGLENIAKQETTLLHYATAQMSAIEGLTIYGQATQKSAVISFLLKGQHPYDVGLILDQLGIAVRTGTHCTEPLMARLQIPGTVRPVFNFYNTLAEVDALVAGINRAKKMLG